MIPKAEEGRKKVIYSPITLIYVDATLLTKKFSKFNKTMWYFKGYNILNKWAYPTGNLI